jgi:protein-S-isoprenylcysteine O-methyltransferase Ste14
MMNILILIGAFAAWGIVHSLLASLAVKEFLRKILGDDFMRLYRLGYNIFSVLSLLPILWLMWVLPDRPVYSVPAPWKYLMLAGQGVAAFLLVYGVLQTDTLSFIGLRQLVEPDPEPGTLVRGGLYRYVRHPLYTAGLLFLWLTSALTINQLVIYICTTIYIFVGATFEERKLMREYGAAYAEYKAVTPMIIPGLVFNRSKRASRV